jgi:hypothetical protein
MLNMSNRQRQVSNQIRQAFQGVTLGHGIGLLQAQAIDDYESELRIAEARSKDETKDWSLIRYSDLKRFVSSLSYFDAEGMRFHLPAFMIADLEGTPMPEFILFSLSYALHNNMDKFLCLNESQRHAVREYLLLYLAERNDDDFYRPTIENALAEYWKE